METTESMREPDRHLDLAEREAAVETVYRLFWAIDARQWDAAERWLADDAVAAWRDLPAGPLVPAIRQLFDGVVTHHQVTNAVVERDDAGRVEVSALVVARHRRPTMRGSDHLLRVSHDRIRLARTASGWRAGSLFRAPGTAQGNPDLLRQGGHADSARPEQTLPHQDIPDDSAQRAAWLADRAALHDLMMRFGRGLDTKDWPLYRACLADRLRVDFAQTTGRTAHEVDADEFVAFVRLRQRRHASFHQYSNFQAHIEGDRARCILYLVARHEALRADGDDLNLFVGWYDNGFVRTPAGWRISLLRHPLQWVEGNAAIKDAPDPEADRFGRKLFTDAEAI